MSTEKTHMIKELNSELFGETSQNFTRYLDPDRQKNSILDLEKQMVELKMALTDLRNSFESQQLQTRDCIQKLAQNQDLIVRDLQRLETQDRSLQAEAQQKIILVNQKIEDRKHFEVKLQESFDKHQTMIKSYDLRLQQLTRLLDEKSAQMQSAQALLSEARSEISRLKRI
jgi:chromosome segregation ATPase